MSRTTIAVVLYGLAAVLTFGDAFVRIYDEKAAKCEASKSPFCSPEEVAVLGGSLAGVGWPLYWSARVARKATP